MPRKTAGESIQDINNELAAQSERIKATKAEVDRAELGLVRERLAVLEAQVAELKRTRDDGERWSKQLLLIVIGAALTLLANVLVNLVLFAKK